MNYSFLKVFKTGDQEEMNKLLIEETNIPHLADMENIKNYLEISAACLQLETRYNMKKEALKQIHSEPVPETKLKKVLKLVKRPFNFLSKKDNIHVSKN